MDYNEEAKKAEERFKGKNTDTSLRKILKTEKEQEEENQEGQNS